MHFSGLASSFGQKVLQKQNFGGPLHEGQHHCHLVAVINYSYSLQNHGIDIWAVFDLRKVLKFTLRHFKPKIFV